MKIKLFIATIAAFAFLALNLTANSAEARRNRGHGGDDFMHHQEFENQFEDQSFFFGNNDFFEGFEFEDGFFQPHNSGF